MKQSFLPFALFLILHCTSTLNAQWTGTNADVPASGHKVWGLEVVGEDLIWGLTYNYQTFVKPEYSLKSLDGGASWTATPIDIPATQYALHIFPLDENTAWLATTDEADPISGKIFKTTDGGQTWAEQSTAFTGFNETPAGVFFWNQDEGVAFGASGLANYNDQISVYRTVDGGTNWTKVASPDFPAQLPYEGLWVYCDNGFFDVQGDNVWFVTNGPRIYRSTDRGMTWTAHDTGLTNPNGLAGIAFKDALNGIVVARSPNAAARTSDGGITWASLSIPSTPPAVDIVNVPGTDGTYLLHNATADWVGNSPSTLVTYDDGTTWGTFSDGPNFDCMEFKSPVLGFGGSVISSTTSGIYKWSGNSLRKPIFVNDDAAGANNGTSWADAFNDLQDALAIVEEYDQIWVAEGIYLPDTAGGNSNATFLIGNNLHLYGGFLGTEASLLERGDPADHPTILSGDLNGDDVDDDFVMNRGDNVMTVVTMTVGVTNETLVDGFTISNGQADGGQDNQQQKGAGIYSLGAPIINHCQFTQNYALQSGGGLFFSEANSNGAKVENCRFEKNQADDDFDAGGGLYAGSVSGEGVTIYECEFMENEGGRGSGLACINSNLKVTNSLFSGNTNIRQGGGLWFWGDNPPVTLDVDSCTFENNHSSFGGGLYASLRLLSGVNVNNSTFNNNMVTLNNLGWGQSGGGVFIICGGTNSSNAFATIKNTQFMGNSSPTSAGGGIGINVGLNSTNAIFELDSCSFSNNTAHSGSGLAAELRGNGVNWTLKNSTFNNNNTTGDFATALVWTFTDANAAAGTAVVDNCLFENNTSVTTGGLDIGSGQNTGPFNFTISNSSFLNNHASRYCGGLDIWGDSGSKPTFNLENCLIEGNTADERGGGFWIVTSSEDFKATMNRCRILDNVSPKGSAISTFKDALNSFAFPENAQFNIENSLISGNSGNATIEVDSFPNFQLLNCTVVDNPEGGIQLSDQSGLTLQNTILYNNGLAEFEALTNDVTVTSLGGNLIGDNSMMDYALTYDQQNADPLFVGMDDYHLSDTSPAIDKGVELGNLSDFDLDGNDRRYMDGCVDIGAYENQTVVSSDCVTDSREVLSNEALVLSPNPTTGYLHIQLNENKPLPLQASLFDAHGKFVRLIALGSVGRVDVHDLSPGMYVLKVVDGERVYIGKFVKQ